MSEFEFLAVFISIIFGISVTQLMKGVMRSLYRGEHDQTHFVMAAFLFLVLILNWWTIYTWNDERVWSFELFLIIIVWAMNHYVAAITLYPPVSSGTEQPFEFRRRWFLWAFIGITITDILETFASGDIFDPWYYLPFVLHYTALCASGLVIQNSTYHRVVAWYFLISMTTWSFVVRRFLE